MSFENVYDYCKKNIIFILLIIVIIYLCIEQNKNETLTSTNTVDTNNPSLKYTITSVTSCSAKPSIGLCKYMPILKQGETFSIYKSNVYQSIAVDSKNKPTTYYKFKDGNFSDMTVSISNVKINKSNKTTATATIKYTGSFVVGANANAKSYTITNNCNITVN